MKRYSFLLFMLVFFFLNPTFAQQIYFAWNKIIGNDSPSGSDVCVVDLDGNIYPQVLWKES